MIKKWKILGRETILDMNLFQVNKKQVRSPRTDQLHNAISIDFPAWVMVMPVTDTNEVVMVRQYRHGIEQICMELPGGLVDPKDPSPAVSAERELLEETGYRAREFIHLGECFPQPAILSNGCTFFLAKGVRQVRAPELDAGEDIELIRVDLKRLPELVERGAITNGMVLLNLFFYYMKEGKI